MNNKPYLYEKKEQCFGCKACVNVCPNNAISFSTDEYGFSYPEIYTERCVGCGLCTKVCPFHNDEIDKSLPIKGFAAINKDVKSLKKSSSGGVFAALANQTIKNGGCVAGVLYDEDLHPIMKLTSSIEEVKKMQGSKYVQANTKYVFREVKEQLALGKDVLFTGTPCQIAGLKSFLFPKEYQNLLTVDIVCHGTPNEAVFKEYIKYLEKKHKGRIVDYNFRCKKNGWGKILNCISFRDKNGIVRNKYFSKNEDFYMTEFLKGDLSRPSCFLCKYACEKRISDITMCDFWGYKNASINLDPSKGLSAVLVNTIKGEKCVSSTSNLLLEQVDTKHIINGNKNLNSPMPKGEKWDYYMDANKNGLIYSCFDSFQDENKREINKARIKRILFGKAYYYLRMVKHRFVK